MTTQEFDTVDVVRLEVAEDPVGLVNEIDNPSGELGGWGWVTPVASGFMQGRKDVFGPYLQYQAQESEAHWFFTEDEAVSAGQYVALRWTGAVVSSVGERGPEVRGPGAHGQPIGLECNCLLG